MTIRVKSAVSNKAPKNTYELVVKRIHGDADSYTTDSIQESNEYIAALLYYVTKGLSRFHSDYTEWRELENHVISIVEKCGLTPEDAYELLKEPDDKDTWKPDEIPGLIVGWLLDMIPENASDARWEDTFAGVEKINLYYYDENGVKYNCDLVYLARVKT